MEPEANTEIAAPAELVQKTEELIYQVGQYGEVIVGSVLLFVIGVIAIYLAHKFAAKYIFPHFGKGRLVKVAGVALYALIIVTVSLLVLNGLGIDATRVGQIALVIVFISAVLIFFLLPFLPKLPYQIGHLVEFKGELGTVSAISPLFTTLQRADGTLIFFPNTSIMSAPVKNYSHISSRLIEINLSVRHGSDLAHVKQTLVDLMSRDKSVLKEQSPPTVFVTKADGVRIDLLAVCWVRNEDWVRTKSDLWEMILQTLNHDNDLA